MQYLIGLNGYDCDERTAVTLGKFDGLHCGHEKLIETMIRCADENQVRSVVCAFNMLPFFLEKNIRREILMTGEEKRARLEGRVDCLVDYPFTLAFSQMSANEFIEKILVGTFHAKYVIVGKDFMFGRNRSGNVDVLKKYEKKYDYELIAIDKQQYHYRDISTTYIKHSLEVGNLPLANRLLGYPYSIAGVVEHGKKLGRQIGFPTINVYPGNNKKLPPNGVYLSRVEIDGEWYPAITNIGVKPTVSSENRTLIESFLFGYSGNAYGKMAVNQLLEFHRPEEKFDNIEVLKATIDNDMRYAKDYFGLA